MSELIDGRTDAMVEIESNIIDSILSNEVEPTKKNPLCSQLLQDTLIWWVIQKGLFILGLEMWQVAWKGKNKVCKKMLNYKGNSRGWFGDDNASFYIC